jgi:ATP-dependent Clp protease ATP-binding subunit ClpB
MFLGPTGVGKTELAKQLARTLFNSEKAMVRIDMSEYGEKHSVAKLIGAPPGYVGFEQGGQLTEAIRRKPYSIVLLDEVEKAHPDVFNVFLQVFDDGRITDGLGKVIDFKNTIIIMTSNIGSELKMKSDLQEQEVMEKLQEFFKAEFINRIDEIVLFNKLNEKQIYEITKNKAKEFMARLEQDGYFFTLHTTAINQISTKGYDPQFGARPLDRFIAKNVESLLATEIIDGKIKKNKRYRIIFKANKFSVEEKRVN